jgi:hypothetical protein
MSEFLQNAWTFRLIWLGLILGLVWALASQDD